MKVKNCRNVSITVNPHIINQRLDCGSRIYCYCDLGKSSRKPINRPQMALLFSPLCLNATPALSRPAYNPAGMTLKGYLIAFPQWPTPSTPTPSTFRSIMALGPLKAMHMLSAQTRSLDSRLWRMLWVKMCDHSPLALCYYIL
jgi:hypothetical protein